VLRDHQRAAWIYYRAVPDALATLARALAPHELEATA
jgi:hypothetical protein